MLSKEAIRQIHRFHRETAQRRIRRALGDKIDLFLGEIANGDEVEPENICPELVEVRSDARTGDLFRFASLLWSIPVSQGYGRRMRYLVRDRANGKLIGIFALGDPVFNLRVRDEWIGWDQADRRERLVNLMDAYVVGAKIDLFLGEIANGDEVEPENICPELVEVRSDAPTGDLFRFASLLWSIPVSQGYGRRMRYLSETGPMENS